jgi:hypothetical protein
MKNRSIILTTILSLLALGGLTGTALAQNSDPVRVVNTPNVNVVNTATNPVPVIGTVATNAVEPARNAVQQSIEVALTGVQESGQSSITIPAGKIFVLETVSVFTGSSDLFDLAISFTGPLITGGNGLVNYHLAIPTPGVAGIASGIQALRLYVQPGTNLTVSCSRSVGGATSSVYFVSLSGYFVNAQ